MAPTEKRVKGLTKTFTRRDLATCKNLRELLSRLNGDYFHTGYIHEHLDLVQVEIEENLKRFSNDKETDGELRQ